jgi:transporter family-2 protein
MYIAFLTAALLAGTLLAVQASANLQLTKAVGTPYGASTVQLSVATGLLIVLVIAVGAAGAITQLSETPAWQLLGGLASPLYITSGILLFPRLGALAAVALFVTGQMLASLGLDLLGVIGVREKPLTASIVLGAAAVLVGITAIIRGQRAVTSGRQPLPAATGRVVATAGVATGATTTATDTPEAARARVTQAGWVLLGIAAGAGLPVQGAVNAQLRENLQAPLVVALISFTVATLTIAAVLAVLLLVKATSTPTLRPVTRMPWWGWLGGACAVVYVTVTFLLIPVIGAATTIALTVTGQQLTSAVIDTRGLFRMPKRTLTPHRLTGLVLLIAGSAIIQLT